MILAIILTAINVASAALITVSAARRASKLQMLEHNVEQMHAKCVQERLAIMQERIAIGVTIAQWSPPDDRKFLN